MDGLNEEFIPVDVDEEFFYELLRAKLDVFLGGWTPLYKFYEHTLKFATAYSKVVRIICSCFFG